VTVGIPVDVGMAPTALCGLRRTRGADSGIGRMDDACKEAGLPPPKIENQGGGFTVIFSKAPTDTPPRVESGIESGVEPGGQSLRQKVLVILSADELSKKGIANALGRSKTYRHLDETVRHLLADDLIRYTIPNKPNSRLQKYRLTEKGERALGAG